MNKKVVWSLIFIAGLVVGANLGRIVYNYENVWPEDRGGLRNLNFMMENDKTDRLAMIVVTKKQQYIISAINEKYEIHAQILEKMK